MILDRFEFKIDEFLSKNTTAKLPKYMENTGGMAAGELYLRAQTEFFIKIFFYHKYLFSSVDCAAQKWSGTSYLAKAHL